MGHFPMAMLISHRQNDGFPKRCLRTYHPESSRDDPWDFSSNPRTNHIDSYWDNM